MNTDHLIMLPQVHRLGLHSTYSLIHINHNCSTLSHTYLFFSNSFFFLPVPKKILCAALIVGLIIAQVILPVCNNDSINILPTSMAFFHFFLFHFSLRQVQTISSPHHNLLANEWHLAGLHGRPS